MRITLNFGEMTMAGTVGVQRQAYAIVKNLKDVGGADSSKAWEDSVVSAMCELAVAKALNLFWCPNVGITTGVDVGGAIEVRMCREANHRLVLRPSDKDDMPYVLVLAQPPHFTILGWLLGRDGKKEEHLDYRNNGEELYFVKQRFLRSYPDLQIHAEIHTMREEAAA